MLAAVHEALAAYGTRVTAVLDLEEIQYDSRVADLARAAVLLGCRYRDRAPTTAEVRAIFIDAYSSQVALTRGQRSELEIRITAALTEKGWA
jgi:homoserine kinase type II